MIPENLTKVKRSQFGTYLDVTPAGSTPTWKILGIGITDLSIDFNPQVETEKWIVEDTARNDHTGNEKQASVSQKIYKGDDCFEFVYGGLNELNYKTHILDVDRWNGTGTTYPATLSDGLITITNYMGDDAVIEYDLLYDGDPKKGTVTYDENGVPTFTETQASL